MKENEAAPALLTGSQTNEPTGCPETEKEDEEGPHLQGWEDEIGPHLQVRKNKKVLVTRMGG